MAVIIGRQLGFHGRGIGLIIVTLVFSAFASGMVMARVISRITSGRKLHKDDYFIIVSLIASIGLTITNFIAVDNGYGDAQATLSAHETRVALEAFYAIQILYKISINLTKVSILLLYLRIFAPATTTSRWFRPAVHTALFIVIGYAIASIFATIFQCTPMMRTFDKDIPGYCINMTRFWYSNASVNVFGDGMILVLPMRPVYLLHLPRRQKWGLYLVFALGFFVCITSVLRMLTLDPSSKSQDQTHDTLISTIWTAVEASTAIICACLPMLKSPLALLFPCLFPRGSRGYSRSGTPPAPFWRSRRRARTPSTPSGTKTSGETDVGAVAVEPNEIPLGQISRTTDVEVVYGADFGEWEASAFPRAHLVGPDYGAV